jgi:3-hydroxyacyl-CoA dehydrogenase/3-hydroxy-2-methylbutyryl-CoA dehydrogenase
LDLAPPPSVFENGEEKFLQFIKTDITVEAQLQSAINRIVEWTKETGAALGGVLSCAGVIGRTPVSSPFMVDILVF